MTDTRQTAADKVSDARKACDELDAALKSVGVKLPSLWLDAASCVGPSPLTLIHLGRCNISTARTLTAALRANSTPPVER
jgi:hypothetical protein